MLKIKELPVMERPYEKLEKYGAGILSDAELLAIIIKSGIKNETSVELSQRIIKENMDCAGFRFLERMTIEELTNIKGIGRVKAIQLKATFEMAKRINRNTNEIKTMLRTPKQVYNFLEREMRYETQENIKILTVNTKGFLIKSETIAIGSTNSANVELKEIFKTAISHSASGILIAHNHPSGDPTPSAEDISFTNKIIDLGAVLGIDVLDHIIVGNGSFVSMREREFIK
jgi:DNA repair protein RadC